MLRYKILVNRARCLLCNDIIESKHRHDYVSCKCGASAVDGGKDYLRRTGFGNMEDLSESEEIKDPD